MFVIMIKLALQHFFCNYDRYFYHRFFITLTVTIIRTYIE